VITVIDYGAGNLQSVHNALARIGVEARVARDPENLADASKLILPGVGHFGAMMRALDDRRLRDTLVARIAGGVPFLGICLGMQALYEGSHEAPRAAGLGLLPGRITRFDMALRVPHMGWNNVEPARPSSLLASAGNTPYYYFANSYYAPVGPETTGVCTYGVPFAALVEHGNMFGVQFHPEKSGSAGLRLLRRFVELRSC
jgi:imidazole glycerol phosphate synthase glutamine amidotransferase subunit